MLLVFWKSTINQSQFLDDIIRQEVTSSCFWLILGCFLYLWSSRLIKLHKSVWQYQHVWSRREKGRAVILTAGAEGPGELWLHRHWFMRSPWVPRTGTRSRDSSELLQTEGYFYTLSPEAVRRNEKDSQTGQTSTPTAAPPDKFSSSQTYSDSWLAAWKQSRTFNGNWCEKTFGRVDSRNVKIVFVLKHFNS